MSSVEIISDYNKLASWDCFVKQHPKAHFFHYSNWIKVLIQQYDFLFFLVCYIDESGEIAAGIPFCEVKTISGKRKWVSLPFSDFCEPLYYHEEHLKCIIEYIIDEKTNQKIQSVEIRYKLPFDSAFQSVLLFSVHNTNLRKSADQLFKSFKTTQVQQPITKSVRDGLTFEIRTDSEAVNEFYKLHLLTRKKLGVPVQPKKYFNCIFNELIKKNIGFIVLVKFEKKYLSGGVFLGIDKILTYKYGASHPKYLRMRPNNLMIWSAMNEGIHRGFESFDFGKTDLINVGLQKFKSGWGSEMTDLYYSNFPAIAYTSSKERLIGKLLKMIIQKSPKFVCRLIGEMFYKYAG